MFCSLAGAVAAISGTWRASSGQQSPGVWDGCSAHQSILRPKENGGAGGVFADGVTINKGALLDIFRATGAVGQILFCCITFKCLTMCIVIITATIASKTGYTVIAEATAQK